MAVVGVLASAGALWLAGRKIDRDEVEAAFAIVDTGPLWFTLVTGGAAFLLMAARSRLVFGAVSGYAIVDHLRAHLIGYVGNTVLPFRIGELLRLDYLAQVGKVRHSSCVGGLVVERLFDLAFMVSCFVASIVLTTGAVSMSVGVVGVAVLAGVGLFALLAIGRARDVAASLVRFSQALLGRSLAARLAPRLEAFVAGLHGLASPGRVAAVVAITIARWSVAFVSIRLWLMAFDVTLPWWAPVLLLASLAFGTALPSAAAFIGTFHAALAAGLSLLGVDDATAIAVAIVGHACTTIPWMVTGAIVLAVELARGRFSLARGRQAKRERTACDPSDG